MIATEFSYSAPDTLHAALALLADGAKPLAGGMSLVPMMKLRLAQPEHLVDLRKVPGLSSISEENGRLHIGALATHYEIESSDVVRSLCPLLATTAGKIGDVQIRNVGTIGGSLAHADPAADYPAAILALDATLVLSSTGGRREVAATDFFVDTFTTAVEPGELLTEIIVAASPPGARTAYKKMQNPASGFALVGIAVIAARAGGVVSTCRIGVTGVSGKAFRATTAETKLIGSAGTKADIAAASAGGRTVMQRAGGGEQRIGESSLLAGRQPARDPPPEDPRLVANRRRTMAQFALDDPPRFGYAPVVDRHPIARPEGVSQQV